MTQTPKIPTPINEEICNFYPNSLESKALLTELKKQQDTEFKVPLVIGGEEILGKEYESNVRHLL